MQMKASVDGILQQIGARVRATIPKPWTYAVISVRFDQGVVSSKGSYRAEVDGSDHSFPVPGVVNRMFMQLRELTAKSEGEAWRSATYSLDSGGHFNIDLNYEDTTNS